MARASSSWEKRKARHARIRKKVRGTAVRPRLCVYRSLRNIFAQLVDDDAGRTLVAVSSLNPGVRGQTMSKSESAKLVGKLMGQRALEMGIRQVVFDRGGFKYHGRVKALADSAREVGLQF